MTEVNTPRPYSSAAFDQYINEHKLMATRCKQCTKTYVPPRAICANCHSSQMEWVETSGKGKLAAFTVIYSGPSFMVQAGFDRTHPYISGIVMLEEGIGISARITGLDAAAPESIKIGTELVAEFVESSQNETPKTSLAFRAV